MPKFTLPRLSRQSAEDVARDREDEIQVSWSERLRGRWARFHANLPWHRVDELDAGRDEEHVVVGPRKRWKMWAAMGAGGLVAVLAGAIYLLAPKINQRLEDRTLRQAREYLRVEDYQRAQLTLEQAVQVNPADLEARRELAQFYEEAGAPRSVGAWQDLVALDPANDDDRLSLAHCALIFGEMAAVEQALAGVSEAGHDKPFYHQLKAAVALQHSDLGALHHEIAELARLQPGDQRAQFNLAVVHLASAVAAERADAQQQLEGLARGEVMRIRATLELISLYVRQNSATAYSRLAEVILPPRHDGFVSVMGAAPRGLLDLVQQMEAQPNPAPEDAAALGEWLVRQGYPADAVLWLGTLKADVQSQHAVESAAAFALARIHDWPGVEKQVRNGSWGKITDDVAALAFAARVQRQRVRLDHAAVTWNDAVEIAPTTESLRVLLRLSNEFGWPNDSIRVLWQLSRAAPQDLANWRLLAASVSALRTTTELSEVYTAWSKAMPNDPTPRGQVRWVQTLLGHGPPADPLPTEMAFPALAAARALELAETGRPAAALNILNQVREGARTDWRVALSRGLTLAVLGRKAESEKVLDLVGAAPLLSEEKALLIRARAFNSGASLSP